MIFFNSTEIVPGVRVIEFAKMVCPKSLFWEKGTLNIFCLIFIFGESITFVMVQFDLRISNKIQIQYFKDSTGRNCTLRLLKSDAFSILRTIQTAKIDEPIPKPRVSVLSIPDIKYQSRNKKIAVKIDRNK